MHLRVFYIITALLSLLAGAAAHAKDTRMLPIDPQQELKYIRLTEPNAKQPEALQVALVRFKKRGVSVDLVSAVHIADKNYYTDLNRRFSNYDVVLYELVAPEGTRIPKGGHKKGGMLPAIQRSMKNILGLTYQLEEIDYTPKHFVHADMSPDEFSASMKQRGESFIGMFFKLWAAGIAKQRTDPNAIRDVDLFKAMIAADRQQAFKGLFARELANSDGVMYALEGEEGSTLVGERNKKALDVLRRVLAEGHQHIAIFYGAGHMQDMQERLQRDFGFRPSAIQWLNAWNLDTADTASIH